MNKDMSNYKMIYGDQVFNVVDIVPEFENMKDTGFNKPKWITAGYIDENGEFRIVKDEAWMFKFVRR